MPGDYAVCHALLMRATLTTLMLLRCAMFIMRDAIDMPLLRAIR